MGLRIVHVVRQYAPSVGGLESVVAHLAREQARRFGHDVRVITLDRVFTAPAQRLPARATIDGIPVLRLSWSGSPRYPLCPQVIGHLADADLVHVHAVDFFFDWLSATRAIHRKPMVASTHGGFFHTTFASRAKRVWFQTVTRLSAFGYRRIIATSENDGATFRRIAGDRVTVIENGVDVDRFRDAASHDETRTLVYFGRWSSNKGLPQLIELLAAVRAVDGRWRLLIAGRPYDLDATALTALARRAGVQDDVELHEAPDDDALRLLIGRSSHFACLSQHEGFGLAAIEAMSAGLVPVLSDIPPFRRVVDESGCGLLLPSDETTVAQAARLLAFVARSDGGGRRRRIDYAQRYEWSKVADRFDALYRDVVAPQPALTRSQPS